MKATFETFVDIVRDVGFELGIVLRTTDILSSSDKDTRQISRLVVETCRDLLTRYPWRVSIGDDPWVLKDDQSYTFVLKDDTDTPLFDGRTIKDGAKWRYLYAKGMTYGESFRAYEKRIQDFAYAYNGDNVVDMNENVPASV